MRHISDDGKTIMQKSSWGNKAYLSSKWRRIARPVPYLKDHYHNKDANAVEEHSLEADASVEPHAVE